MNIVKEYSIKEEQEIHLQLLKHFDEICKKESLQYFLAYGTLLGAVRENGFIPWDDDIDLWMMRDDYEKFRSCYQKYKKEELFFQDYKTDPKMPVPGMMRICINGTFKWRHECEKKKFHTGIYFDIFPLDYVDKNDKKLKKEIKRYNFYNNVLTRDVYGKKKAKTFKSKIYKLIINMFPKSLAKRRIVKISNRKRAESDKLVCYPVSFIYPRNIHSKEHFNTAIFKPFEDMECPCPIGYDALLTQNYGDWRTPSKTKPERIIAYKIEQ